MSIFNKLLRAGEKAEALRTAEGSAIDRLASNKLMTGRQAIGKYATDAGSWAIAGGVLGSFAPVNPMGGGDSFGGATSGAMAGAMIGGIAGGRTLLKNMAKGRIVGSEAVDALASGVKNYKPRTINTFQDLAADRKRSVLEGYKINRMARRGNGDYQAGVDAYNAGKAEMNFMGPRPRAGTGKGNFRSPSSADTDALMQYKRNRAAAEGAAADKLATSFQTDVHKSLFNGKNLPATISAPNTLNSIGGTNASQANAIINRGGSGIDRIGDKSLRMRNVVNQKRVNAQLNQAYKNLDKNGWKGNQLQLQKGVVAQGMSGNFPRGQTSFQDVTPIKQSGRKGGLRVLKNNSGTKARGYGSAVGSPFV